MHDDHADDQHNEEPVVAPGHDRFGQEYRYEHTPVFPSVLPDPDILFALRDEYIATPVHPEWRLGGSDAAMGSV